MKVTFKLTAQQLTAAHNLKPSRRLTLQSQCAFYGQSFS